MVQSMLSHCSVEPASGLAVGDEMTSTSKTLLELMIYFSSEGSDSEHIRTHVNKAWVWGNEGRSKRLEAWWSY